jgi:replicative DNA helicase
MASDQLPPSDSNNNHCTDPEAFLRILHEPGAAFEVRSINCPERAGGSFVSTVAGWFNDPSTAAQAIDRVEALKPPAVYVTLNPVEPALLARSVNRLAHKAKSTTKDEDILRRRWLFVDIDARRPAGVSSTDGELAEALAVAESIRAAMITDGWPEPLQGMSGNGAYLLWRVDLPNDDQSTDLVKHCLMGMAYRFNTDGAEVDCSTFNAARICKVLGTVARKGDELIGVDGVDDRPHRRSWFIEPDGPLQVISSKQLQSMADQCVEPERPEPKATTGPSAAGSIDVIERARRYLAKMPGAVAGNKGHNQLFAAASALVIGFDLSADDALMLLAEYNQQCVPPWSDKELRHKVTEAEKLPGERGRLLHADRDRNGAAHAGPNPGPNDPWDDPLPIDAPEVGPFPAAVLPGVLGEWVEAMAEAAQVPSELPGLLALAVCSGAVARRVAAGRGWVEPVNLFVCCLLDPANRKSAVFRSATEPLRLIEAELLDSARPDVARALAERRMIEAQAKKAESKAAGGDEASRTEALELAEQLATEPVPSLPRLIIDDATAEAVELALAAQEGRLIVAGPEGGIFDVMAGRYSSAAGNLDCFLKGHAGDDLRVDRVTRGSINVPRCCLTLAYAVQPEVIRGLADKPSFRGRGLIGRFLYAMPMNRLGSRSIDSEPVPDALTAAYVSLVRSLFNVPCGLDETRLLMLAPEAAERFKQWQRDVEPMLADDGRLASMRDWGGKLCGLTARLAAVMHLARYAHCPDPVSVPVGPESIEAAVTLARWAVPHAEAAVGLMAAGDGSLDDAAYVLRWLRERALSEVTRRDVYQFGRARFTAEPLRLDRALGLLVDRGWLRSADDRSVSPGRPSVRYLVHPSIVGGGRKHEPESEPEAAPVPPWESSIDDPAGRVRMVI